MTPESPGPLFSPEPGSGPRRAERPGETDPTGWPTVSAIIPTYNRLAFLREAVDSVLRQTYRHFELIVVDDGSGDGTRDFVQSLTGPVRYVFQPNVGPAAARNRGIACARGELLAFLDSDDLWLPAKLQRQVAYMTAHPEALICHTDEIWIRRGVRVNPRKKHRKRGGWIFESCLPLCIVSPSSVMMRRAFFETVGGFDEAFPACEDYELWLRASLRVAFHYLDEKLVVKRGGHAGQLSRQWGLDRYRVQALLKLLDDPALTPEHRPGVERVLREKCRILEQGFRKRGKDREAQYYAELGRV